MKTIILTYLLTKSALNKTFTHFDMRLALALRMEYALKFSTEGAIVETAPAYLVMIANMTHETALPEAWADFLWQKGWTL